MYVRLFGTLQPLLLEIWWSGFAPAPPTKASEHAGKNNFLKGIKELRRN